MTANNEPEKHMKTPDQDFIDAIVQAVCGIVSNVAEDLAIDASDYDRTDIVSDLVEVFKQWRNEDVAKLEAAKQAGVLRAANGCNEDPDCFEPCTDLDL